MFAMVKYGSNIIIFFLPFLLLELRLETMEELFRIENTSYICGCCPDIRTAGLLGKFIEAPFLFVLH